MYVVFSDNSDKKIQWWTTRPPKSEIKFVIYSGKTINDRLWWLVKTKKEALILKSLILYLNPKVFKLHARKLDFHVPYDIRSDIDIEFYH
jgi:hypothetical protein